MPSSTTPRRARKLPRPFPVGMALLFLVLLAFHRVYVRANRVPHLNIPTSSPLPADNAYDDFLRASKLAFAMKRQTPANMPASAKRTHTFANYKAAAIEFAPALAIIHQALAKSCLRPTDRNCQFSLLDSHSLHYLDNASLRNLARNIDGAGRYEQLAGHPLRAADVRLDGVEMNEMSKRGGQLIDGITAQACNGFCLQRFEELLPLLTASELRIIASRLEQIQRKHVPYSDIVLESGYSDSAEMLGALRDPNPGQQRKSSPLEQAQNLIQSSNDKLPTGREAVKIAKFVMTDKQQMLEETLDYYRAVAEEAKQPYTGKSRVPVPNNYFAEMVADTLHNARVGYVRDETVQTILRTEVALCRYKAERHEFPDRLDALTPAYLPAMPADPFGGALGIPLRYKLTPDGRGYVLYSIGRNLTDEGGTPSPKPVASYLEPGDIVAGHLYHR